MSHETQVSILAEFVLCKVDCASGPKTKMHKGITTDIRANYGTESLRAVQSLFAKGEFDELYSLVGQASRLFRAMTLAHTSNGAGLILPERFAKLDDQINEIKTKLAQLASEKAADFDGIIDRAKEFLNGAFVPSNYPQCGADIEDWFSVTLTVLPHPSRDLFAESVMDKAEAHLGQKMHELRQRAISEQRAAVDTAMKDAGRRLVEPFRALAEKMVLLNGPAVRCSECGRLKSLGESYAEIDPADVYGTEFICDGCLRYVMASKDTYVGGMKTIHASSADIAGSIGELLSMLPDVPELAAIRTLTRSFAESVTESADYIKTVIPKERLAMAEKASEAADTVAAMFAATF